jgi:shikimate kinase
LRLALASVGPALAREDVVRPYIERGELVSVLEFSAPFPASTSTTPRARFSGMMIRLIGPGGAGKSSTGPLLAARLGIPFVDLDERFSATVGDISAYIHAHGYDAYAARNVQVYADAIRGAAGREWVLALSSGFMTYREDIHPAYLHLRREIAASPTTCVLLPSLDAETCVAEIVRRQLGRPFSRSAEREEEVIRARFAVHRDLPVTRIETMRPLAKVVEAIVAHLVGR